MVVDGNFNRIKVKSPKYVTLHHAANGLTKYDIIRIVRANDIEEVLTYFPKYELLLREWEDKYKKYRAYIHSSTIRAKYNYNHRYNQDRKTLALKWAKAFPEVFKILDIGWDWKVYIEQLTDKQLLKNIENRWE